VYAQKNVQLLGVFCAETTRIISEYGVNKIGAAEDQPERMAREVRGVQGSIVTAAAARRASATA